ncbi:hypothetical protein V8G54_035281 [Vigna mungo]|uniref:Uncharacterized protein n=1 Tax=Vigna mungo TaxID=3915 RepID=A0AAQ3MER4_VIGMU
MEVQTQKEREHNLNLLPDLPLFASQMYSEYPVIKATILPSFHPLFLKLTDPLQLYQEQAGTKWKQVQMHDHVFLLLQEPSYLKYSKTHPLPHQLQCLQQYALELGQMTHYLSHRSQEPDVPAQH